jgi:hypothetical protein
MNKHAEYQLSYQQKSVRKSYGFLYQNSACSYYSKKSSNLDTKSPRLGILFASRPVKK